MKTEDLPEESSHVFPAVRGIQSGREYYTIMCPLKMVRSIFTFNEREVPVKLRMQRVLNKARVPEIASYVANNPDNYTFSSITVSVDGNLKFIPLNEKGIHSKVGLLYIEIGSNILINDGQHRRAGIIEALNLAPQLGHETISVVLYHDRGLKHSQQMFTDLNKNAVKPTKSLNILYDKRDPFSSKIVDLIDEVPIFKGLTEVEKTSLSNRTHKVFTLNSIFSATSSLLGKKKKKREISMKEYDLACEYWNEVNKNIPLWNKIVSGKLTPYDARIDNIAVYGVFLHALGIVGRSLIKETNWKSKLSKLKKIDFKRSNVSWNGRCIVNGRLTKHSLNIKLTANYLKKALNIKLNPDEIELEKHVGDRSGN
jgi:DNA sulfur modification protein DndB